MKEIETERLVLKPWKEEYADSLFAYAKNPDVGPHGGWKPHESVAESLKIIKTLFMPNDVWAIALKGNGKIVGSVGLEPDKRRPGVKSREIGYSLAKEYWGNGIITEAVEAVLEFAFDVFKLEVVCACTSPENKRSQKVLTKCGMTYEGTERRVYKTYDGTVRDSKCYSVLREEWEQLRTSTSPPSFLKSSKNNG